MVPHERHHGKTINPPGSVPEIRVPGAGTAAQRPVTNARAAENLRINPERTDTEEDIHIQGNPDRHGLRWSGEDPGKGVAVVSKLKLFIWTDFCPDYSSWLAFAIAENETEARKLIIEQSGYEPFGGWGNLEIKRLDQRVARSVSGGG